MLIWRRNKTYIEAALLNLTNEHWWFEDWDFFSFQVQAFYTAFERIGVGSPAADLQPLPIHLHWIGCIIWWSAADRVTIRCIEIL